MPGTRAPGRHPEALAIAASVTLGIGDMGKFITTRGGAGALTFTLPAATAVPAGSFIDFYNCVDQNMIITAPAGTMMGLHNAACATATFSTASQKIGANARVTSDGTSWLCSYGAGNAVVFS